MRRALIAAAIFGATSECANAQPQSSWTVSSGIEQFSLRDIVRSGPPVDASPISWEGSGPVILVAREWTTISRRHAADVTFASARDFEYRSPFASFATDPSDAARRFEGRYEYDRRVLSRHLAAWIEATVGVRGSGQFLSLTHHVDPAWDIGLSTRSAAAAIVAAATFARGRRVSGDVRYGNALVFGWLHQNGDPAGWSGGGWTTDLDAGVNVRTSRMLSVTTRVVKRDDGFLATHREFSTSTPRLTVGIRYAK